MINGESTRSFVANPLAFLAASFGTGIAVTHFVSVPLVILLVGGSVAFGLVIALFLRKKRTAASLLVLVATILAGASLHTIANSTEHANQIKKLLDANAITVNEPIELTGTVNAPPESAPEGLYLTIKLQYVRHKDFERSTSGIVKLLAVVRDPLVGSEYEQLELRYGARIRVMTALNRTDNFRNPGVSSFTEYLERKGFDATGVIKSPLLIERLDDERVFLPLALLYRWRQLLLVRINKTFSPETAGVLDAALLGNRYFLSHGAAERFRAGGTFHVLVISGLHISFIGGLVFLVMRRITGRAALQFIVSVAVLWGYAVAVGAEPSVVRAALMFTLLVLAPLLARRAQSLNILGATAMAILIWQPNDLFDPSFQLTFLSVLMIVTLGWPFLKRMEAVGTWHPTATTPFPPICSSWFRDLSEALFWRESKWRDEMSNANFSCRLFKTPIAAVLSRWYLQRPLRFSASAILISAAVLAGLLPLLVLYFHRFSIAALVLNIGVGVLMAALGLVALLALGAGQVSPGVASPLIRLAEAVSWLMVHSADLFAGWRFASMRLPEYTGPASAIYALYFIPLVGLLGALARWNPLRPGASGTTGRRVLRFNWLMGGSLLVFLILIVAHPLSAGRPSGYLRIDFLDVGQGDAALLTMPDGTTLMIDGGGRPSLARVSGSGSADDEEAFTPDRRSIGDAVVSEYLWWCGLDQVDYVLATHADADHIDGLNDVVRNFRVRGAIVGRAPAHDAEFQRFAATLKSADVPLLFIGAGDVLRFGDVSIETLWPVAVAGNPAPSSNNHSIVLRVRYGEKTVLLTGDIEKEAEAALVDRGIDLRSDVVKVAHHGSRTSSTDRFVDSTRPALAVISVGRASMFGHPHPEVVERWRRSGAQVLTTGERGMITVATDGRDLHVSTFVR